MRNDAVPPILAVAPMSDIEESGAEPRGHAMLPFELRFMRLERAAMSLAAADSARAATRGVLASLIMRR